MPFLINLLFVDKKKKIVKLHLLVWYDCKLTTSIFWWTCPCFGTFFLIWSDPKFVRTMILNPLVYPLSKSILPNNLETSCWCLCSGFVFLVPILLLRSKYDFFFVSCWTNYKLVRMNAGEICINDCRCRISKGWVWKPCWRSGCYPFRVKSLVLILESSTVLKSHHHVLCAILDSEFKAFFFSPRFGSSISNYSW